MILKYQIALKLRPYGKEKSLFVLSGFRLTPDGVYP